VRALRRQARRAVRCIGSIELPGVADKPPGVSLAKEEGVRSVRFLGVAFFMLLTLPSYAQQFPESSRQKTQEERKKQDEKANDEAYKAWIKRTPDSNKKVDPWGDIRAPSAGK
jgi:hypothetical protein